MAGANLGEATLEDADLRETDLSGATLSRALLSNKTTLDGAILHEPPILLGVRWNGAPLDGIDWNQLSPRGLGKLWQKR